MMREIIGLFGFIVFVFLTMVGAVVAHVWPTDFWFEVRSVRVFDSKEGERIVMAVDRTIKRDFRGYWTTSLRRLENGGWVSYCTSDGSTNYQVDSKYPEPLTLKWWTYPNCHPLGVGKYMLRTNWVIRGIGPLPDKEVTADSNIFEVKQP